MMPFSLQDMATCDPKGRNCTERNSSETFHCNTTCAGIYADIEWVKKDIDMEMSEEETDETMKADLKGNIDDDLMKIYSLLKNEMKLMKKILISCNHLHLLLHNFIFNPLWVH